MTATDYAPYGYETTEQSYGLEPQAATVEQTASESSQGPDQESVESSEAGGSKAKARARQKERDRTARTHVRAGAKKVLEIQAAGAQVRSVVAAIAGCPDDDVEVAVALAGPRGAACEVLKDLEQVIADLSIDPLSAGITVMGMGAERTRPIWNLLHGMGVLSSRYPNSETKAALDLARAISGLGEEQLKVLSTAAELTR